MFGLDPSGCSADHQYFFLVSNIFYHNKKQLNSITTNDFRFGITQDWHPGTYTSIHTYIHPYAPYYYYKDNNNRIHLRSFWFHLLIVLFILIIMLIIPQMVYISLTMRGSFSLANKLFKFVPDIEFLSPINDVNLVKQKIETLMVP